MDRHFNKKLLQTQLGQINPQIHSMLDTKLTSTSQNSGRIERSENTKKETKIFIELEKSAQEIFQRKGT
jgi:hypothetical protein